MIALEEMVHKRLALEKRGKMIRLHLEQIPNTRVRAETEKRLRRLEQGERDLYF
ncbi:MAG: hypothetical protein A4E57_00078 [Syntrophorhabdaceae bacterium PtaU1.Bin034]|nr:MAG: hypothetical protein A4E57_00078 [Syntrophorhabdaceae bacterium PtaU1.Bin034]